MSSAYTMAFSDMVVRCRSGEKRGCFGNVFCSVVGCSLISKLLTDLMRIVLLNFKGDSIGYGTRGPKKPKE